MRVFAVKYWVAAFALAASVATPALGDPNCTCRYKGQSYALDSCVCLSTPDGPRMACCGMVLNNTSWNFTKKHCPVVKRSTPGMSLAAWHEEARSRDGKPAR
jgi:hypothetical protein